MKIVALAVAASLALNSPAVAQSKAPPAPATEEWPEAWFEIFKLAPGKQEEFIRRVDQADQVAATVGLPPIQLFFHESGADFDVIMFKPVTGFRPTPEQKAKMDAKRRELGMPSGPAYFVNLRELVAAHTDSKTTGPVSAAKWLNKLDRWRAENPSRAKFR